MKNDKGKKFLYSFLTIIILIFFLKITITTLTYFLVIKYDFNNFIISKFLPDERVMKMILLKKNNEEYDTYFFGTSSATVYYPEDLKNFKINAFNVAFSAANTSEHLKYLKWIIKNKTKPKYIFLELRDLSVLNHEYKVIMPPELERNFLKIQYYLTDLNIFKYLFNKLTNYSVHLYNSELLLRNFLKNYMTLNTLPDEILEENISLKLKYITSGTRYYQSYFDRKNDHKLQKINNNQIIKKYLTLVGDQMLDIRLKHLKEFVNICINNNIKYKVYFGPVYIDLLNKNNDQYLIREIDIIEKLLEQKIVDKIYYFNNNELSKHISNFEKDMIHYTYDVARNIAKSLINEDYNESVKIFNKKNILKYKNGLTKINE